MKKPRKTVDESIESNHSPLSLKLYLFSFLQGVAGGIWGFLSIFLLDLGGSAIEVGILSTVPGLASTFMQLAWGRITDRLGKSWRMVSTGFLLTSLLSLPVLVSTSPWQVILATGVQALLGSIAGVAVTVRLAEVLEPTRRARFMGIYNPLGFAGNIAGSFSAGFFIPAIGYRFTFLGYTVINSSVCMSPKPSMLVKTATRIAIRPRTSRDKTTSLIRAALQKLARCMANPSTK